MMKVGMKYRLFSLFEINGCIGYGTSSNNK